MTYRNLDTPEGLAFWKFVDKCAKEVDSWPCWKRASGQYLFEGSAFRPCKDTDCTTCYDDATARKILSKRCKYLKKKIDKLKASK